MIDATPIGTYTKSQVSYLPDKNYFADWMTVKDIFDLFSDFYADFDRQKALHMCDSLGIGAVSYTHLDVYKRQVRRTADAACLYGQG